MRTVELKGGQYRTKDKKQLKNNQNTKNPYSKLLIILAFFSIYVIWGSTYMLNKIVVGDLPPFFLAGVRFLIASILIFCIAKGMGISLKISRIEFKNTLIAGFLFVVMGNGMCVWALKYLDSGLVALINSAQPLILLLMIWFLQNKKIRLKSCLGVGLGILGVFLLTNQEELITNPKMIFGLVLVLLAIIAWSYGSLFVAKAKLPSHFFINTAYQMLFGGIMLFAASIVFDESWKSPLLWNHATFYAIGALIVFGSILAYTSFNYLLQVVSPEKVATCAYVNPVVALLVGWYFLGEVLSLISIIAAVILLTGVYFINSD